MMPNRGAGFGQPGPRTYEQKGWQAEILKPLILAIGLGVVLNLLWALSWCAARLFWPYGKFIAYFAQHPDHWVGWIVVQWIVALFYLILKWTETFWDDDYTTLVGDHPLLGILPMRPIIRVFLLIVWIAGQSKGKPSIDDDYRDKLRGGDR